MKNQMYALGRVGIRALGILALFVSVSACTDEYTLDDEKPAWLGESVYMRLAQDGNFTNYLRLMDDLGMKEVLSRTGSRTVFAANDDAFNEFYRKNAELPLLNPWHSATSYDNLSKNQKALLANCTMLNNSITMETLATQEGTLERGKYLRRKTLVTFVDSITKMGSAELPYSYNMTGDYDYWADFRSQSYTPGIDANDGPGIFLTDGDGTVNMMLCFTAEQMAKQNVTDEDFALVMGQERNPTDVFVYDAKIVDQDITCQNGYINMVEKVIRPLPNMAEVIRTNGRTNIFSHILDRFSAPVYVSSYNELYSNANKDFEGKIYTKWYFSGSGTTSLFGKGVSTLTENGVDYFQLAQGKGADDKVKVLSTYKLKFDPAWNACSLVAGERAENDMAAMFVPDDETLFRFFKEGTLRELVEVWTCNNEPNEKEGYPGLDKAVGQQLYNDFLASTLDNLEPFYKAIDQIPLNTIQSYVNNLMRESYNGSVKSKFPTLKNDAQESLFGDGGCVVKNVELACNGAVYITESFHAPADYSSVAAPAYMNTDKRVMKFAIYDGDAKMGWNDYMRGLNYYAYLKAMTSRFTLFLPDDEAMQYIYSPMSFAAINPRLVSLSYNRKFDDPKTASGNPILYEVWNYSISDARRTGNTYLRNASLTMDDIAGILTDILQTHTLVHESEENLISKTRDNTPLEERDIYYITKSNDAVKVTYAQNDDPSKNIKRGDVLYVQGGFQIENEQAGKKYIDEDIDNESRGTVRCTVKGSALYQKGGNGDTYVLKAPIIPAVKSVYGVLSEHKEFEPFLELCMGGKELNGINDEIIEACGFYKNEKGQDLDAKDIDRLKSTTYSIFFEKESTLDMVTSFFNLYQYSVFVPNGDAIERARQEGFLYDWDDIENDFLSSTDADPFDEDSYKTRTFKDEGRDANGVSQDSIRLRAKITHLFNFVRLHFMDGSVFADNSRWEHNDNVNRQNYATYCFYQTSSTQGNFMKLHIKRNGRGVMTVQGMNVNMDGYCGDEANVLDVVDFGPEGDPIPLRNMMAREITVVNNSNAEVNIHNQTIQQMNNKRVGNSSSAVIHLIDQTLRYTDEPLRFENPENARRYLKYNKVVNKSQQN